MPYTFCSTRNIYRSIRQSRRIYSWTKEKYSICAVVSFLLAHIHQHSGGKTNAACFYVRKRGSRDRALWSQYSNRAPSLQSSYVQTCTPSLSQVCMLLLEKWSLSFFPNTQADEAMLPTIFMSLFWLCLKLSVLLFAQ